jgi:hypothetical protein
MRRFLLPPEVLVLPMHVGRKLKPKRGIIVVNTTSSSGDGADFSPFLLGPCNLYHHKGKLLRSENMENAWQFAKVYREHYKDGKITEAYWRWALKGWADERAHRYPMGKGRKPEFSLWRGQELSYIDARKKIYGPLYAEQVTQTEGFEWLKNHYDGNYAKKIVLLDYDAYDHKALGKTLSQVLNDPMRKMGHAFVLMMLLTNDMALDQMELR